MASRTWTLLAVALALALAWWLLRPDRDAPARPRADEVRLDAAVERGATISDTERPALDLRRAARAAISGRVRDPQGRAIAGASVCAGAFGPGISSAERDDRRCVVSEADGAYRIDDLLPVPHLVDASAPTFIPAPHRRGAGPLASPAVRLLPGKEARDVDITLRPGGVALTGVVRDLSGGELEGALVSARYAHARSALDGTFTLWVAPGLVYLDAVADGYAPGRAQGIAPGHAFDVYLTPESVLVGRVVRADDGAPLAGAEVRTAAAGGWRQDGPAITDERGEFRLAGLQPGAYKAEAVHDEAYGVAAEQVVLGLGETSAPLEIRAHPAFLVEGTVQVAGAGACEGGSVRLHQPGRPERDAAIEPDGSARARGLLPGTYEVRVACNNHVSRPRYDPLEIVDHAVRGVRWEVDPGQAIRGVVLTARNAPVPDLPIAAQPLVDDGAPPTTAPPVSRDGATDSDGRFELVGLLPGRYRLESWSQDRPRPEPLDVVLRPGQDLDGVRLTLPATGELRGTVKDSDGRPVKDAMIALRGDTWSLPHTRSLDDGTYRLPGVPPGTYRVRAGRGSQELRAPGTTDDDDQGAEATVTADDVTRVDLVVESQTEQITGRVVDGDGGPLADAFIEATRESDSAAATAGAALRFSRWSSFFSGGQEPSLTDQDGRFTVSRLSPGNYTLVAHRRGGGEGTREHVATGADVELRIADASALVGAVGLAGGGAPERFTVTIRDRTTGFVATDQFFRTGGTFRLPEVPRGDYDVTVEAAEGSSTARASVPEGGRGEVRLELAPRVAVRGRVVDLETGAPVPGMRVAFLLAGAVDVDRPGPDGLTDAEGRFEVDEVPVGDLQASITPRGLADGAYGWSFVPTRVPAGAPVVDLPALRIVRQRTTSEQSAGDLGYRLRDAEPDGAPRLLVGVVRPGGPAARAGLQVGDEVVSVDGHDVTGASVYLYHELTNVAAGATVRLGLARGATLELTADRPR